MQREGQGARVELGGITIELGDSIREVEAIPGAREKFAALKLPMSSALLRYRHFRESTLAPDEAIARVMERCLKSTGVTASGIDMFILTSADARFLADRKLLPNLLKRHGMLRAVPMAIVSQECTGLLSAIHIACTHIRNGLNQRILVASYDRGEADAHRIQPFGVISDAAAACLVSSMDPLDFSVLGFAQYGDVHGMHGEDNLDQRQALINKVTAAVLAEASMSLKEVSKVFSTNFFWPLATYNATTAGFSTNLLHEETLLDVAHCLSADALINLDHYHRKPAGQPGDRYLLQAFAMGLLASMLVERTGSLVQA
jgi:3-oxoacyl-[acyl-carrier-protein] synthase III